MEKLVIFGIGDLAELIYWYLENDPAYINKYEIVAFTVTKDYIKKSEFKNLPVVAFEYLEEIYPPNEYKLFAPITGIQMNMFRKKIYEQGKCKGYDFISYISSKATVCGNKIGDNCFILEDNTIQPFTVIGNNVVMWSGNHIGHHGIIEDHVFFTSHVVLSGHCHVKERAWFGVNATIRDAITIEEASLIAMGSTVTKSTEKYGVYMGSPAEKRKTPSYEVF